jgi:hypothetical protein
MAWYSASCTAENRCHAERPAGSKEPATRLSDPRRHRHRLITGKALECGPTEILMPVGAMRLRRPTPPTHPPTPQTPFGLTGTLYSGIRARPVALSSVTVSRRVSHRALRCGPPACAGKARRRHGWRERPCMQRRFPAAFCRLPAQGPGRRDSTNCVCRQRVLQSSWAGARVVALERLPSMP